MAPSLVHAQSPEEFFKEEVEAACRRQALRPQPLTDVLRRSLARPRSPAPRAAPAQALASNEALGVMLVRALQQRRLPPAARAAAGRRRLALHLRLLLRQPAPAASSTSTTTCRSAAAPTRRSAPSITRSRRPSRSCPRTSAAFVDVLADVSERTPLAGDQDLLRLYERWVRTGSRRDGELLVERGIVPNVSVADGARTVQ